MLIDFSNSRIVFLFFIISFLGISGINGQTDEGKVEPTQVIYISPHLGLNRVESNLFSRGYFNNYTSISNVTIYGGVNVGIELKSGFTVESGLTYIQHSVFSDSLNIPPTSSRDIWSEISFDYSSINVPLRLGYNINLGDQIILRPDAGLVVRYLLGHDYMENVMQTNLIFNVDAEPALLYDFESFGIATEVGLSIIGVVRENIKPFVRVSYFQSSSNFRILRGQTTTFSGAVRDGAIQENGLLISVGMQVRI